MVRIPHEKISIFTGKFIESKADKSYSVNFGCPYIFRRYVGIKNIGSLFSEHSKKRVYLGRNRFYGGVGKHKHLTVIQS